MPTKKTAPKLLLPIQSHISPTAQLHQQVTLQLQYEKAFIIKETQKNPNSHVLIKLKEEVKSVEEVLAVLERDMKKEKEVGQWIEDNWTNLEGPEGTVWDI